MPGRVAEIVRGVGVIHLVQGAAPSAKTATLEPPAGPHEVRARDLPEQTVEAAHR
jgi:hypothetical protein